MASNGHRGVEPPLLTDRDPPAVKIVNPAGRAPYLFIGDHAGNVIPSSLQSLGLRESDLRRHIAWDIGVDGLGVALAEACDATFVRQTYSRLVVDCNRDPGAMDAMPAISDATIVSGNVALSPEDRAARVAAVHEPYQRAIADTLSRRDGAGQETILISLHSFTPALADGTPRPWEIGVLHDGGDPSFALALLARLRREPDLTVGDNAPYRMDAVDYTVPRHAYASRRLYAELEIRQDLLGDALAQLRWTTLLVDVLSTALQDVAGPITDPGFDRDRQRSGR
ncbi:N-formylglutamate amidohydrolase [Sphingomonas sp. RHCKR7]|uniref:N-formylglutamate amidohydrolase n=1 Tax=Sphingomonas folli TaxID=2862497 RepID=UPI001CA56FDE|nr:N-formylglutamate amidohydrolase [Sphingomonas folli]MBW6526547.1 N-formylglutamate amidohydrolase [Sphingomonas folli]